MSIVALNCGSSSIKCAVLDGAPLKRMLDARIEQIGTHSATFRIRDVERPVQAADINAAVSTLLTELSACIADKPMVAVVHRIVHGGERFTRRLASTMRCLGSRCARLARAASQPAGY
jgi:acetate kinase